MYILKHFDDELLRFEVLENLSEPVLKINWINREKENMLPIGMEVSEDGLVRWLKHCVIPKNRAYVNSFLAKCGLNANRPMDVITVSKGLSLNDSYWIADESFSGDFEKVNLFENNKCKNAHVSCWRVIKRTV